MKKTSREKQFPIIRSLSLYALITCDNANFGLSSGGRPYDLKRRIDISRKTLALLILFILAVPVTWCDAATAPAIYYTFQSSSSDDYIPEYDLKLESDTYHLIQDFPAANAAYSFDWIHSASYAKSYMVVKTSGDRLFGVRGWDNGSIQVYEYNPDTLEKSYPPLADIGADLFFYADVADKVHISDDYLYWYNDGDGWEVYNLNTGDRNFLGDFRDIKDCNKIVASATHVFCVNVTDEFGNPLIEGDYVQFYQIDRATGNEKFNHGWWHFGNNNDGNDSNGIPWHFAADGAVIYAIRPYDNETELFSFDTAAYQTDSEPPTLEFSEDLGFYPFSLDAEDGNVMLSKNKEKNIFIYDASAGMYETITTVLGPAYPEFMMQEVPQPSPTNPDPTPNTGDNPGASTGGDGGGGGGGGGGGIFGDILKGSVIGYHLDGYTSNGVQIYMPVTRGFKALKGAQEYIRTFAPNFADLVRKQFDYLEQQADANKDGFLYQVGTYVFPILGNIAENVLELIGEEKFMDAAYADTTIKVIEFKNLEEEGLAIAPKVVKEFEN